jgi:DNA-3-methyladenine glycosylase
MVLNQWFFNRDSINVARALLGKKLIRKYENEILSGYINETEAYVGSTDSASHAYCGKTTRNAIMFGPAGFAYVYFVYGKHYMLNVVTSQKGIPAAVLIRSVIPLDGVEFMQKLRNRKGYEISNGPGKLCQAMAINMDFNGWDLTKGKGLWLENYRNIMQNQIICRPRIGIDYANEQDRAALRRFSFAPPSLDIP